MVSFSVVQQWTLKVGVECTAVGVTFVFPRYVRSLLVFPHHVNNSLLVQ